MKICLLSVLALSIVGCGDDSPGAQLECSGADGSITSSNDSGPLVPMTDVHVDGDHGDRDSGADAIVPEPLPGFVCEGNSQRFVPNSDGTVTDCQGSDRGLLWQQNMAPSVYTWENAKLYCSSLVLLGTGWRLPTIAELNLFTNIPEPSFGLSAWVESVFPDMTEVSLWSSSPQGSTLAWTVDFKSGKDMAISTGSKASVRCVR